MEYTNDELRLLWLDSFIKLDYKKKYYLLSKLSTGEKIKDIIVKEREYLVEHCGEEFYKYLLNCTNKEYLDNIINNLNKNGVNAITIYSEFYPDNLKLIEDPPFILYTKGNYRLLKSQMFSIVGSRKSLPLSKKLACDYAMNLFNNDITVVTGIAEGVERAIIDMNVVINSNLIVVLANGFNQLYPKNCEDVFNKMAERQLVISEYPLDVEAKPYLFLERNRIIAGLAKGVLIVSGGKKSGTLSTATYATQYGRDVFAIPSTPGIISCEGCNELIKNGAYLTDSPSDITEFYGLVRPTPTIDFTEQERELLELLLDGERHIDYLCEKTNRKANDLVVALIKLQMKDVVVESQPNTYMLTKSIDLGGIKINRLESKDD